MSTEPSFDDLNLILELERALNNQSYTVPTEIQVKAIPSLLKGKDLIGIAQTGTGKTAAFVLPILQMMKVKKPRIIKTLVLAPTRELAAQIGESFETYGKYLKFKHTVIFGGVGNGSQINALKKGVDIVVATPGRLLELLKKHKLNLDKVGFFVLDEADRMLDMGFIHDIKKINSKMPSHKQNLFFSATMSPEVTTLANSLLKKPIRVEITAQATTVELIDQHVFYVDPSSKEKLLLELLQKEHLTSVLVFTRTKHKANRVALFLYKNGIKSDAIHGDKSQKERTAAIQNFKDNKTRVLVATDIAARGIDINNISHIINFELPNQAENYVHRIGRTARAGVKGTSYSFCAADERNFLRDIEALIKKEINVRKHTFHSEMSKNASGKFAKQKEIRKTKPKVAKKGFRTPAKSKRTFSKQFKSKSKFKKKR